MSSADYHTACNAWTAYINESSQHHKSISHGAIAGAVIGGLIALVLILGGGFLLYRHLHWKKTHDSEVTPISGPRTSVFSSGSKYVPSVKTYSPGPKSPTATDMGHPNINGTGDSRLYDTRILYPSAPSAPTQGLTNKVERMVRGS